MLIACPRPQFVEKIITSETGERFCVTFLVAFVNGEVKGKVISVVSLGSSVPTRTSAQTAVLSLPAPFEVTRVSFTCPPSFIPKISPYFSLDFFVSQPTRAPSF